MTPIEWAIFINAIAIAPPLLNLQLNRKFRDLFPVALTTGTLIALLWMYAQ